MKFRNAEINIERIHEDDQVTGLIVVPLGRFGRVGIWATVVTDDGVLSLPTLEFTPYKLED